MLRVVYALATHGPASVPMLEYLSPRNSGLLTELRAVLLAPLPPSDRVLEAAACLHQKSWIMRLQARALECVCV
jgi:hypothetical protein